MSEEIGNEVVTVPQWENVYHYEKQDIEAWGDVKQLPKLIEALSKAQAEFDPVVKTSDNEGFKRNGKASKYADLAENIDATRKHLSKHGLTVVQLAGTEQPYAVVTTLLLHVGGAGLKGVLKFPVANWTAHGVGGGLTYARRYAYQGMLSLASEDDDGNTASGKSVDASEGGETSLRGIGGIIKAQKMTDGGAEYAIFDPATKRTIELRAPDEAMGSTRLIDQVGKYVGVKARPLTADKDCSTFVLHDVVNVRNDNSSEFREVAQDKPKTATGVGSPKTISDAQRKRLWAIAKSKELSETHLRDLLGRYGYESTGEVQSKDYEKICADIDPSLAKG